jgi:hypothetical protein
MTAIREKINIIFPVPRSVRELKYVMQGVGYYQPPLTSHADNVVTISYIFLWKKI